MKLLDHNGRAMTERLPELRDLSLQQFIQAMTADPSPSYVSSKGSLRLSTVYACIRLLANSIAMTPLKLYRKARNAREVTQVTNGPFANIARDACPLFNNFTFWQAMITSLNGWGNAYAVIIRDRGIPQMLIYLTPDQVSFQDTGDPRYYFLRNETPYVYQVSTGLETTFVLPQDMIHLITLSYDGLRGLSPVQLHQDTFQVENEQTKYGSAFYASGAKISGVIESPRQTSRADAVEFVTWFNEIYGGNPGQAGAGRIAFLPNGLQYKSAAVVNPQDAEWVEARKLSRREIASIYGVPPYLLGDLERATWSSITQLSEEFVRYTLNPLYTVIETELNRKLLDNSLTLHYEFDPSVMLRGTTSERYNNYSTAINAGFMSPAEVREKEGLPFREELDYFLRMPGANAVGEEPDQQEEQRMLTDLKAELAAAQKALSRQDDAIARQNQRNFDFEVGLEKLKLLIESSTGAIEQLRSESASNERELAALNNMMKRTLDRFDALDELLKAHQNEVSVVRDLIVKLTDKLEDADEG